MGLIDSATTVIDAGKSVTSLVSAGPASALSSVTDSVTGALDAAGGFLSKLGQKTGPLPNPLASYATYNYILGLGILKENELHYPDTTYMTGKRSMPLICKSANVDPNNRVTTPYGKFEFYIDNLIIDSMIGFDDNRNSAVTSLEFEIIEPYSTLMFPLALQAAAYQASQPNWREASYLLTIEFRGNKEDGTMQKIPGINRYIPIKLTTMTIKASEKGTRYLVRGYAYNNQAQTKEASQFKTDVQARGKTVQEILQTGPQSLQAVVNQRLMALKDKGVVKDPDEVIILFPEKIESSASSSGSTAQGSEKSSATTSTTAQSGSDLYKKLGVSIGVNKTLVQPDGQCNELGKAETGLNVNRRGKVPLGKPGVVYNEKTSTFVQGALQTDPKEGTFNFSQSQDIPTAINEVLLSSNYVNRALDATNVDEHGMRNWWMIDTQVYYKSTTANLDKTGVPSRLIVYRVIPYKAHSSTVPATNAKGPGFSQIAKTVVKKYDYIYTGKNTEVLKFDIDFSISFANVLASDAGMSNQDNKRSNETAEQDQKVATSSGLSTGNKPEKDATPGSTKAIVNELGTDNKGGGSPDTPITRAARVFHDALTKNLDMIVLNMDIMGDPYWIPQSGMGNYTAAPGSRPGLAKDGSVDYQRRQIHTYVNFRSPLDLNQMTGMYNFGKSVQTNSVVEFSGLYTVNRVTSTFRGGKFIQTLKGNRPHNQERKTTDTPDKTLNSSQPDANQGETKTAESEKLDYQAERNAQIDP